MKILTSGEVARILGVSKEALFYREEAGQIPKARRTGTGKRYFLPSDIKRLQKYFGQGSTKRASYRGSTKHSGN
ncbi:MAG: MerR family transcriptional regulator [Elusimicrobia bacterium]|nr:MerR family transcriptional regulator [Elusimicrobiota bacterium]